MQGAVEEVQGGEDLVTKRKQHIIVQRAPPPVQQGRVQYEVVGKGGAGVSRVGWGRGKVQGGTDLLKQRRQHGVAQCAALPE